MKKYKNKKLYIISIILLFFAPITFILEVGAIFFGDDKLFNFYYDVLSLDFIDKYGKIKG